MSVAFLVDGQTEQRFIQLVCSGNPVQRLNLNGSSVSAEAIAKRAATQIRLWRGRHYPIVILVDLEDRSCDSSQLKAGIEQALSVEGICDRVLVGVANRMIENWVLADCGPKSLSAVDGLHGCNELKRLFPSYDKAADGPEMLRRARASVIRQRSPSFSDFQDTLSEIRCHWLAR